MDAVKRSAGDADNLERLAAQLERSADCGGIRVKARAPEGLGDDRHARSRRLVLRLQDAAVQCVDAKGRKVVAADTLTEDRFNGVAKRHRCMQPSSSRDGNEARLLRADIDEIGPRQRWCDAAGLRP